MCSETSGTCAHWGRAAHSSGVQFTPLDPGDPPLLLLLAPACVRPSISTLLGGRAQAAWVCTGGGLDMSKVLLDGWQERSKRSTPLCVLKTSLPSHSQQHPPDIALACRRWLGPGREWRWRWWLTTGRFSLCCWPLSEPHMEERGWWQVAGWPAAPSSRPFTQKGEWEEGVVEGAQQENTSNLTRGCTTLNEGLHWTYYATA